MLPEESPGGQCPRGNVLVGGNVQVGNVQVNVLELFYPTTFNGLINNFYCFCKSHWVYPYCDKYILDNSNIFSKDP